MWKLKTSRDFLTDTPASRPFFSQFSCVLNEKHIFVVIAEPFIPDVTPSLSEPSLDYHLQRCLLLGERQEGLNEQWKNLH